MVDYAYVYSNCIEQLCLTLSPKEKQTNMQSPLSSRQNSNILCGCAETKQCLKTEFLQDKCFVHLSAKIDVDIHLVVRHLLHDVRSLQTRCMPFLFSPALFNQNVPPTLPYPVY